MPLTGKSARIVVTSGAGSHGATINNLSGTSQTIATGTGAVDLTMNNVAWDTDGYTGVYSITIPAGLGGMYLITASATVFAAPPPASGTYARAELYNGVNGVIGYHLFTWNDFASGMPASGSGANIAVVAKMTAGDYIEWTVRNVLGVNLSALGNAGSWFQSLSAVYLHA